MFNMTSDVQSLSDAHLTQFVKEIFKRNITSGKITQDSALLHYLADRNEMPLGDFEKVCLAEFIWRGLQLNRADLIFDDWIPGSDTYDYLGDETKRSVRERN